MIERPLPKQGDTIHEANYEYPDGYPRHYSAVVVQLIEDQGRRMFVLRRWNQYRQGYVWWVVTELDWWINTRMQLGPLRKLIGPMPGKKKQ